MSARVKRVAFQDSDGRPKDADERAAVADRFQGVLAARGSEPTARREKRADSSLVDPNQPNEQIAEEFQQESRERKVGATELAASGHSVGTSRADVTLGTSCRSRKTSPRWGFRT